MKAAIARAKELIQKGWTQGNYARDRNGYEMPLTSPAACQFCLGGALRRALLDCNIIPYAFAQFPEELEERLDLHLGMPVWAWNDAPDRKKEEVLDLLIKLEQEIP